MHGSTMACVKILNVITLEKSGNDIIFNKGLNLDFVYFYPYLK